MFPLRASDHRLLSPHDARGGRVYPADGRRRGHREPTARVTTARPRPRRAGRRALRAGRDGAAAVRGRVQGGNVDHDLRDGRRAPPLAAADSGVRRGRVRGTLWKNVQPMFARADLSTPISKAPAPTATRRAGRQRQGRTLRQPRLLELPAVQLSPVAHPGAEARGRGRRVDREQPRDGPAVAADAGTIANLEKPGLPFMGTRSTANMNAPWFAITEAGGIRIALGRVYVLDEQHSGLEEPGPPLLRGQIHRSPDHQRSQEATPTSTPSSCTPHWGVEYAILAAAAGEEPRTRCSRPARPRSSAAIRT